MFKPEVEMERKLAGRSVLQERECREWRGREPVAFFPARAIVV